MLAKNIVVYTAPGSSVCHAEKEFLMAEMNSQSTPTTVIDGEVIIGFDKEKMSEKLGL